MQELDAESIATLIKGGATALSVALGSKPAAIFIEKVSGMIGWAVDPITIKRKARAEATASLIKAEADQEVKGIEQRTTARLIYEETKFQQNIESIVIKTIANIRDDARIDEIDDDWLANLFEKCRRISNEEMHKIWAQILAGEINRPGSFSARTVNFLSTLSPADANLIRAIKSCVWHSDRRESYLMIFNSMFEKDEIIVLDYTSFLHLDEIGVIHVDNAGMMSSRDEIKVTSGNKQLIINKGDNALLMTGHAKLTSIGLELCRITEYNENPEYYKFLLEAFENLDYEVEILEK